MLANAEIVDRVSSSLLAPDQIAQTIAFRLRGKRRELRLSQSELAKESGVSLGSLKRFEHDYLISLESLIKLSVALGCEQDVAALFSAPEPAPMPNSLEEMVAQGHLLLDRIASSSAATR